jgi:adenosine deaminase
MPRLSVLHRARSIRRPFASTDHAERAGVDPLAYLAALTDGIKRAEIDHGIVSRIIPTGVRHFGQEAIERAARYRHRSRRKSNAFHHRLRHRWQRKWPARLLDAQSRPSSAAAEAGLGLTAHAGEWTGPPTIP